MVLSAVSQQLSGSGLTTPALTPPSLAVINGQPDAQLSLWGPALPAQSVPEANPLPTVSLALSAVFHLGLDRAGLVGSMAAVLPQGRNPDIILCWKHRLYWYKPHSKLNSTRSPPPGE